MTAIDSRQAKKIFWETTRRVETLKQEGYEIEHADKEQGYILATKYYGRATRRFKSKVEMSYDPITKTFN